VKKIDGQDFYIAFVKGLMVKRNFVRPYLVFRMMTNFQDQDPVRVTMTLMATHSRLEFAGAIATRIAQSFKLLEPKPQPKTPGPPPPSGQTPAAQTPKR